MAQLDTLYALVEADLARVDTFLKETLRNGAKKASLPMLEHVLNAPGKRIRPILMILVYRALSVDSDQSDDNVIKVAAAIELIHMASLVHDDVIDNADMRRGQASVKAVFGNSAAVAMGVYLYSVSLQLIAEAGSLSVLRNLSTAVKGMCEGELVQLAERDNVALDWETYLLMLKGKTAELFAASCAIGAELAQSEKVSDFYQAGLYLGYLFQLTDDYLDFFGSEEDLNKKIGQDFLQGQITAPIIMLHELNDEVLNEKLEALLLKKDDAAFKDILVLCNKHQIPGQFKDKMQYYYDDIVRCFNGCASSSYQDALLVLAAFIHQRI